MEMLATENMQVFLMRSAGIAQIVLVVGSLLIPHLLQWKSELSKTSVLIKQMFWTYAAYILVINLCFGLVSYFAFVDLINGSPLATMLTGFIAVYWISRVAIQFLYFDRTVFPKGVIYTLGEVALVCLFVALSAVYVNVFIYNINLP